MQGIQPHNDGRFNAHVQEGAPGAPEKIAAANLLTIDFKHKFSPSSSGCYTVALHRRSLMEVEEVDGRAVA